MGFERLTGFTCASHLRWVLAFEVQKAMKIQEHWSNWRKVFVVESHSSC